MGSYNPIPYDTFGKIAEINKTKGSRPKSNYLGTAERFPGSGKKGRPGSAVPGPGQYPMIAKWPGKN